MAQRRKVFESMGIEFQLNTTVGDDISFEQLQDDYDAVFLGLGAYKTVDAGLGEGNAQGVYKALDYLIGNTSHLHQYNLKDYPFINLKNKVVAVLGGGDTAMDCVRTAIRQGAEKVMCVYRKDKEAMPGSRKEFNHAIEEGVEFIWHHQAESVERTSDGKLVGLHCQQTQSKQSSFIECDAVVVAYGFRADPPQWLKQADVECDDSARVKTSEAQGYRTSQQNIYAGGDMVRGADLVVTAIAEGRKAAESICADLGIFV